MPQFRGMAAVLVFALTSALLFSHAWHPAPPPTTAGVASADVPLTLAGYTAGGDEVPSAYVRSALPGAHIIERNYRRDGADMDFLLLSGSRGVALHDPRLCMGSLLLSAPQTEHLAGTPVRMQVYKASSHAGQMPDEMVAYFYVDGKQIISDPTQIRVSLFWNDLFGRPGAPVYFFRFIQPLTPDSQQDLNEFATGAWQAMRSRVYLGAA